MGENQLLMNHGKSGCTTWFVPRTVSRLYSSNSPEAEGFPFQDLCEGVCPDCSREAMSWWGINDLKQAEKHFFINDERHRYWYSRKETDLSHTVQRNGKGAFKVRGSQRCFPWRFMESIPVLN